MTTIRWALAALILVISNNGISRVSGLHIRPMTDKSSEERGGETVYFVDASGLNETGTDFYQWEQLDIQLMDELPVWNIINLQRVEDHFAGESEDGMVACNLMRHSSNGQHPEKLVGMVHDRANDLWYDIRVDLEGQVTFTVVHQRDFPPLATDDEHMAEVDNIWNTIRSFWYYLRDLPWHLRIDPDKEQVVDIMIVWSENAECSNSGLDVDCDLTEETKDNMIADSEFRISITNFVMDNSDTYAVLNLTHAQRDTSGYREKDCSSILMDMVDPVNGALTYIQQLRDKYKADLVSFVLDNRVMEDTIGGCAYTPLIPGLPLQPFLGYSTYCVRCSAYVSSHEWGHNMGCYHDRGTEDACDDKATNYGYRSPTGTFSTIMSYGCVRGECDDYQLDRSCPWIPYYSGVATYQNGEPMGGEENNCRERIKLDKRSISRFR